MKALKFKISGSYRNSRREVIDFDNVVGTIPYNREDIATMHVIDRYAVMWVKNSVDKDGNKTYPERIESMRQVFVEAMKEVDAELSFMGKDIKEMDHEELQDLATHKDLRQIPLPREISDMSLREIREEAYVAYSDCIEKTNLSHERKQGTFKYYEAPPIYPSEGHRFDASVKLTNDEVLKFEEEMDINATPKTNMTIDDLQNLAREKNIPFTDSMGFDALYEKIFGGQ